jgi:succinate dehydrogenase/fumarate reductase flavoprotein subunit
VNHLSTDILVIGSGGAGLRVRRQGINVLSVLKSETVLGNCTTSAMGAFKVSRGEKDIAKHFPRNRMFL